MNKFDFCKECKKPTKELEKLQRRVRIMEYMYCFKGSAGNETLKGNTGGETGHMDADNILCELLKELGYGEVVEAYENIPAMWYS